MKNEFGANYCIKVGPNDTFFLAQMIYEFGAMDTPFVTNEVLRTYSSEVVADVIQGFYLVFTTKIFKKLALYTHVHVSALENR